MAFAQLSAAARRTSAGVSRFALALGAVSVALGAGAATAAFGASRRAVLQSVYASNLSLSRTLAGLVSEDAGEDALVSLDRIWGRSDTAFPGTYLCVVGADGRLLYNSKRPHKVGTHVGDVALPPGSVAPTVGALARDGGSWVGRNRNHAGVEQLAAYSYSPALDGLIAVHVPADEIDAAVEATALPWLVAALATVLGLLPLSLFLLYRAYRRAEDTRRALEAELVQRQRLQTLGIVAASVAHEVNNPLHGVLGFAELLSEHEDPSTRKAAEQIHLAAERMQKLVRNMLSFSNQQQADPVVFDVEQVIRESLALVRARLAKDHIELRLDLAHPFPALKGQPHQLQQVLLNLLLNARDALNTRYPGADPDKIVELSASSGDREVVITVRDHGAGFSADTARRAREPFFTTKGRDQGTGLGLWLCQRIISEHGGTLDLSSAPGQHTSVQVRLPRTPETERSTSGEYPRRPEDSNELEDRSQAS